MTALAITLGVIALVGAIASFVAVRSLWRLLESVRDQTRILHVSVNGLEAALTGDLRVTRETSEATLVRVGDLVQAMERVSTGAEVETAREADVREALGGRVKSARALFALAEAESMATLEKGMRNG